MKRHAARIMEWLGFNGGKVHYFGWAAELLDTVVIVVEHPDLLEIAEGEYLSDVHPVYEGYRRTFPKIYNPLMRLLRNLW